ncbi:NAD(P)/FAD-dependent oxidoreductase [Nitrosovibrio tenuis]|uniref:NADH:ubiquinone reductase (non-electrogenic) n=1 Tax=Nitrosovibrio tenuis TaxID=1233 RepID=A0A1H7IWU4_9PROT|nr:NAD(P)/FAD-dependent oxidoreductase [Nitrosovibrio tenuis]SEK66981.1 NADH dehydrogenase [Nitrosovibrio tenuis]
MNDRSGSKPGYGQNQASQLPRIVILGAGFGGLTCARALQAAPAEVTLVDQRNFHLFQPLLYQVATAALSPADIATPIRRILRNQINAKVVLGHVEAIDRQERTVRLRENGRLVAYDILVIATGARHSYFGHEDWEAFAPGLKQIEDALDIRNRVLDALERAEATEDADERQRLLSFAVIGGGPTGVELAGAIAELAKIELAQESRTMHGLAAHIVLIEAGPQILPVFVPSLADKARRSLEQLGVEVLTNSMVEHCDSEGVIAAGKRIEARTLIWAAGVAASPAAQWLDVEPDRAGRVRVLGDLSLPGDPTVFVIGDTAAVYRPDGRPVPGIAPAAKQEGNYVAELLLRRLNGSVSIDGRGGAAGMQAQPEFHYHHAGDLATIGHKSAVLDFGWIRLSGLLAWLLWGCVHIFFLISFRNRMVVMLGWLWSYFASDRGARLITGSGREL